MFALLAKDLFASEKGLADMVLGKFQMVLENPIARELARADEIDRN